MTNRCSRTACAALLLVGCAAREGKLAADTPGRASPCPRRLRCSPAGKRSPRAGDSTRAEEYMMLAVREGYPEQQAVLPIVRVCAEASRFQAALDHALPFLRHHPLAWRLRIVVASTGRPRSARRGRHRAAPRARAAAGRSPCALPAWSLAARRVSRPRGSAAQLSSLPAPRPRGPLRPEVTAWLAEQRGRRDSVAALQRPVRNSQEARP